jgi:hypothetical protein
MLSKAKDQNAEQGITGCLLYHNSHFLQLLEGGEKELDDLYGKIINDKRHHKVKLIQKEEYENAIFDHWSMAFYDYGQAENASHLKMDQIDAILKAEKVFTQKNNTVLPFFANVKDILFA